MTRMCLRLVLILAFSTTGSIASTDSHRHHRSYRLLRGKRDMVETNGASEQNTTISFSGSLDEWKRAQDLAQTQTSPTPIPTPAPVSTPTLGPTEALDSEHPSSQPSPPAASAIPTVADASSVPSSGRFPSEHPSSQPSQPAASAVPTVADASTVPSSGWFPSHSPTVQETSASPSASSVEQPSSAPSPQTSSLPTSGSSTSSSAPSSSPTTVDSSLSPTAETEPSSVPTLVMSAVPSSTPASTDSLVPTMTAVVSHVPSTPLSSEPTDDSPVTGSEGDNGNGGTQILSCPGPSTGFVSVTYRYAMETEPEYDLNEIQETIENALNEHLATELLSCTDGDRRLDTIIDSGFNGFDSAPDDPQDMNAFCTSSVDDANNVCTVWDGNMTVYVREGADVELLQYETLVETSSFMSRFNLPGLASLLYLAPLIGDPSGATSNGDGGDGLSSDSKMDDPSILLYALGGVSATCLVGLAVFIVHRRRTSTGGITDDLDTAAPPTAQQDIQQVTTQDTQHRLELDEESDASPLSPFSSMLPTAYRFDDNLSVILETQSNATGNSDNILISEGGYSTSDESSSMHSSLNQSNFTATPVLGARRRKDENLLFPMDT